MNSCSHHHLLLLPKQSPRLRCQHCHLTINANELNNKYCPECFEESGKKRYDFEEVNDSKIGIIQYRCEDCGAIIDCR
jgi:Zn finger protein HypA/HybF involved in hydrogenase expression